MEIERKLRVFNDFLRRIDWINLITVLKTQIKLKSKINKLNFLQLYLKTNKKIKFGAMLILNLHRIKIKILVKIRDFTNARRDL